MSFLHILTLLSGIALFLFGMTLMGDSLNNIAGNKLQVVLYKLAGSKKMAILLGAAVTAVIQSSSATSIMVVGFVNSGVMKVTGGISIILGAILGTSITGWVVSLGNIAGNGIASILSTTTITAFVAIIGIIPYFFLKKKSTYKDIGSILMGFAVLMYGMSIMSSAVSPLRNSPVFINFITSFENPVFGILFGLLFTTIIQSSSATVGILQTLSLTGSISFSIAFPILVGIGIGAAVPVLLSALSATNRGKRTAFSYLAICAISGLAITVIYYILNAFVGFKIQNKILTVVDIALLNTIYRLVIVILTAPFINVLEKYLSKFFPDDKSALEEESDFARLDDRLLKNPAVALEQCKAVTFEMANRARLNLENAFNLERNYDEATFKKIEQMEDSIDRYDDKISTYLMKLTSQKLTDNQTKETSKYLHAITDFERIGDHAMNIAQTFKKMNEKAVSFSNLAQKESDILISAIREIFEATLKCFYENDYVTAVRVEPFEELIDEICDKMKFNHVERLHSGICKLDQGFPFLDLVTDCERISDHCSNIAIALIELKINKLNAHEYALTLKEKQSEEFSEYYEMYAEKYQI